MVNLWQMRKSENNMVQKNAGKNNFKSSTCPNTGSWSNPKLKYGLELQLESHFI